MLTERFFILVSDAVLGQTQEDEFKEHNHGGGNHSHSYTSGTTALNSGGHYPSPSAVVGGTRSAINNSGTIINNQGGVETRPQNLTVNTFIKINKECNFTKIYSIYFKKRGFMKIILIILLMISNLYANVQTGSPIKAIDIKNGIFQIGDVKQSLLNLEQFQSIHGNCWRLMNGSSLSGTDLHVVTGMTTLPNATTNGEFLRQAKTGRVLGSTEGDTIRNISGQFGVFPSLNGTVSGPFQKSTAGSAWGGGTASFATTMTFNASLQVPTSDENRPKNIAVNMFVKVNNNCE